MSKDLSHSAFQELIKKKWGQDQDMSSVVLEKDDMSELVEFLKSTEGGAIHAAADLLGSLARHEANRNTLLSHTPAMAHTVDILRASSETRIQQFCARLVANLCFNNDDGRKQLIDNGGVEHVCKLLSLKAESSLQRVVCGAIANMCSTHEAMCEAVAKTEALPTLISLLTLIDVDPSVLNLAVRAIGNVSINEQILSQLKALGTLKKLVDKLVDPELDYDLAIELVTAVATQIELRSNLVEFVDNHRGIELLLKITADHDMDEEEPDPEDQSRPPEEDALQKAAFEVLVEIAKNADTKPKFDALDVPAKLSAIVDAERCRPSTRRRFACRCIAELSTLDEMSDPLWKYYTIYASVLADKNEALEVRINASVALGNVACNDQRCLELMQSGIAAQLLQVLAEPETNKTARLLTNVCSAIKNVSVKQENKKALIDMGALKSACHLTKVGHEDIVIFGGITLMKSLLLIGASAAAFVVKDEQLIGKLIDLSNSAVKKRENHVLYEAARSICSIVVQADDETRKVVANAKGLDVPIELLLTSKFGILHAEACRALSQLYSADAGRIASIVSDSKDIIPSLVSILGREEEPKPADFVPTNANDIPVIPVALDLLSKLSSSADGVSALKKADGLTAALTTIIDQKKSAEWVALATTACQPLLL